MISPGAVEMGGFIVTPKKNDFEKLNMENIESIFREISLEDETFERVLVEIAGG